MITNETSSKSEEKSHSSTTPLDTIHHIAVVVPDIETGVAWYTKKFHCTIEYVDNTWALLNFANTKLALVLPQEHPAHFAVARADAEKFGPLITHRDGLRSIYVKDMAGNPLEILEEASTKPRSS